MQGTTATTTPPPTRRRGIARNGVVAGSVWETRMKMDEVKGGIKVFNGGESRDEDEDDGNADEEGLRIYRRLRRNQSDGGGAAAERKKRKSWRAPEAMSINGSVDKSPIHLRKTLSEPLRSRKEVVEEEEEEEVEEIEIEAEEGRKSFDDKEMDAAAIEKAKIVEVEEKEEEKEKEEEEEEEEEEEKVRIEKVQEVPVTPRVEKKTLLTDQRAINPETIRTPQEKKAAIVMNHRAMNPEPIRSPRSEKKPALTTSPVVPVIVRRVAKPEPIKQPPPVELHEELYEMTSCDHRNMQNIVDLVMWRDVSKSAFIFGFGTFLLISSSYTKDLNFSLISAVSYLGLVYLALMFIYKAILQRGANIEYDERDERYMVGEEEAIWLVRLLLPYINEMLSKLRALFSGDPATTMKLALLLFAMARCGSSITLWTLAKLFFFGVFTVPKVCSSYSTQLARYGKFWLERFRDGWESCTHKKAVAAAVFTLIWNVSSTVARIWAVFMLVVAVKFYQQCMVDEWNDGQEEEITQEVQEDSKKTDKGPGQGLQHHRQRGGPAAVEVRRERKTKRGI
ncbi:uncharacterized protein [Typha latifolia]|uniref:uncharacterized protein isoform X2 n=1 Tax=Typha latifolia TaxID=4733 RepID=UPI003C2CDA51